MEFSWSMLRKPHKKSTLTDECHRFVVMVKRLPVATVSVSGLSARLNHPHTPPAIDPALPGDVGSRLHARAAGLEKSNVLQRLLHVEIV